MCISPIKLGPDLEVGCRKCWQCVQNRIDELAGRAVMEQVTCDQTMALTLTYGETDDSRSKVLNYSDVQNFLKRLRKKYMVRFLCAGEYGELKGRAHWHIILFFYGEAPDLPIGRRCSWSEWPFGWTFRSEAHFQSFKYLMKYAVKGVGDNLTPCLKMSKKPPLGEAYLRERARFLVENGKVPVDPYVRVEGIRDAQGKPFSVYLGQSATQRFVTYICDEILRTGARVEITQFWREQLQKGWDKQPHFEEFVHRPPVFVYRDKFGALKPHRVLVTGGEVYETFHRFGETEILMGSTKWQGLGKVLVADGSVRVINPDFQGGLDENLPLGVVRWLNQQKDLCNTGPFPRLLRIKLRKKVT